MKGPGLGDGVTCAEERAHGETDLLRRSRVRPKPCVVGGWVQSVLITGAWKPPVGSRLSSASPPLGLGGSIRLFSPDVSWRETEAKTAKQSVRLTAKADKPADEATWTPRRCRSSGHLVFSGPRKLRTPRSAAVVVTEGDRMGAAERDPRACGHTTSDPQTRVCVQVPSLDAAVLTTLCAAPCPTG